MNLKEQVEKLRELYDAQAAHAKNYLTTGELIKKTTAEIKETMDTQGLDSFDCAVGELVIESKDSFVVSKEDKDKMIAYFEADPSLAPLVKVTKGINFQTGQKTFRDMYRDENEVPDFVKVETYTTLKPKFNEFKQQQDWLTKIKQKQKKDADGENAE